MDRVKCTFHLFMCVLMLEFLCFQCETDSTEWNEVPCIQDDKFYRNAYTPMQNIWDSSECAKYYLCLDNEVFEFKCSEGLYFDVIKQICDSKFNVDNCDIVADSQNYSDVATKCNATACHLPDCWCSNDGTLIPSNLSFSVVPQMITITFDDAINTENIQLFTKLFNDERKNPNGCPIRGTFFVIHQYTNYRDVQYLWNIGHEIATHSITHRGPEEWWSKNATIEDWFDEMIGVANIISKFAGVRIEEIKGLRAPFLQIGSNRQFLMMSEFGFVYDSSIVAPFSDPPIWPYTLDYKPSHSCTFQSCPTRAHPGIWELPLNEIRVGDNICKRIDSCPFPGSKEEIFQALMLNFERHYTSNRAPLGFHFHASWFQNPTYFEAFSKFLDEVLRLEDVYFLTNSEVIRWMQSPISIEKLNKLKSWQCNRRALNPDEIACTLPNTCELPSKALKSYRYFYTCYECPKQYPWLKNEFGRESSK